METTARRIGILAGGGSLPREVAEEAQKQGHTVHIVAIDGEVTEDFEPFPVTHANWGAIGRMVSALKTAHVTELIIVGSVTRPNLRRVKPDRGFFLNLPSIIEIIASGGDDSVLRRVIRFFERQGLRVVGMHEVAPGLVIGPGPLGSVAARKEDEKDIATGFDILRRLGPLDVGQAVVVNTGQVEAIEGAEGTDRMLERVAHSRVTGETKPRGGVLVKRPKAGQELRIDLPAVGPNTATLASRAGLAGIAVLENAAIAARRADLISSADESSLFIEGRSELEDATSNLPDFDGIISFVQLGKISVGRRDEADLIKGLNVLKAIAPYEIGSAVAVARRHVLAVESGEGLEAFVQRVKSLRQWGGGFVRRKVGMAIFGGTKPFGVRLIAAVADAGLRGLVIARDGFAKDSWPAAIVAANDLKLFIGALTVTEKVRK